MACVRVGSRRFRAAKEREALLAEYVAKFGELPKESSFDSNCITPGTEFRDRLGNALFPVLAHAFALADPP